MEGARRRRLHPSRRALALAPELGAPRGSTESRAPGGGVTPITQHPGSGPRGSTSREQRWLQRGQAGTAAPSPSAIDLPPTSAGCVLAPLLAQDGWLRSASTSPALPSTPPPHPQRPDSATKGCPGVGSDSLSPGGSDRLWTPRAGPPGPAVLTSDLDPAPSLLAEDGGLPCECWASPDALEAEAHPGQPHSDIPAQESRGYPMGSDPTPRKGQVLTSAPQRRRWRSSSPRACAWGGTCAGGSGKGH